MRIKLWTVDAPKQVKCVRSYVASYVTGCTSWNKESDTSHRAECDAFYLQNKGKD